VNRRFHPATGLGIACLVLLCALPTCSEARTPMSPTIELVHTELRLRLDEAQRQVRGDARLTLQVHRPVQGVALDAVALAVERVADDQGRELSFALDPAAAAHGSGALRIALAGTVPAGSPLVLDIRYRTGHVNPHDPGNPWGSTGEGLRWLAPTDADPRRRRQVWTSLDAATQRHWMPTLDAPGRRQQLDLTITVPRPLVAVASGVPAGVQAHGDGTRSWRFRSAAPLPVGRIGWVVGEYVELPTWHERVALTAWSLPDEAAATAASVVRLPQQLARFEQWTGVPFPHQAYAQVFVQDVPWGQAAGALAVQSENMVDDFGVHADFLYLWDALQAETLAHQWYGTLLSADHWRDAWLERGFARAFAAFDAEATHHRAERLLWFLQPDQASALADDAAGAVALVPDRLDGLQAWRRFAGGSVPLARGHAVLQLLRHELGDDAFFRLLRQYTAAHAGRAVSSSDLARAASAVAGRDLEGFFDQWVRGRGHPVFEVERSWDGAAGELRLVLRQTQPAPWFGGAMDIDIDGRAHRVQLQPQAENHLRFKLAQPPALVHVDREGAWLKELRFDKPVDELLHQLRHTTDPVGRQWASQALQAAVAAATADVALRERVARAHLDVAMDKRWWWRERFNALGTLRTLLTRPGAAATPLDDVTRAAMRSLVDDPQNWLRTAALRLLGDSRDPGLVPLYRSLLDDASDRVINAAAIALGKTGDARALPALLQLPAHPSWKNQSLISALAGLKELRDPRGAGLALQALADVHGARWVLATSVWDYPLAAAETLAALGQGARGLAVLAPRLDAALAADHAADVFYTARLVAALGDPGAAPLFDRLEQHLAGRAGALDTLAVQRAQWQQSLDAASR
jgi:aminopeptidase N